MKRSRSKSGSASRGSAAGGGVRKGAAKPRPGTPKVTQFAPASSAIFKLDKPVDPATVVAGTSVRIQEVGGQDVPCSATTNGKHIIVSGNLELDTSYKFILETTIKDTTGRPLAAPYVRVASN